MSNFKAFSYLFAGFLAGGASGSAVVANALPGDVIYERASSQEQCIANATASCLSGCVKNAGLWNGALSDIRRIVLRKVKDSDCSSGVKINIKGFERASAKDVPTGSIIHGVATE